MAQGLLVRDAEGAGGESIGESLARIVQQCLDGMPEGPWIVDDRKIVLPPRERRRCACMAGWQRSRVARNRSARNTNMPPFQ